MKFIDTLTAIRMKKLNISPLYSQVRKEAVKEVVAYTEDKKKRRLTADHIHTFYRNPRCFRLENQKTTGIFLPNKAQYLFLFILIVSLLIMVP